MSIGVAAVIGGLMLAALAGGGSDKPKKNVLLAGAVRGMLPYNVLVPTTHGAGVYSMVQKGPATGVYPSALSIIKPALKAGQNVWGGPNIGIPSAGIEQGLWITSGDAPGKAGWTLLFTPEDSPTIDAMLEGGAPAGQPGPLPPGVPPAAPPPAPLPAPPAPQVPPWWPPDVPPGPVVPAPQNPAPAPQSPAPGSWGERPPGYPAEWPWPPFGQAQPGQPGQPAPGPGATPKPEWWPEGVPYKGEAVPATISPPVKKLLEKPKQRGVVYKLRELGKADPSLLPLAAAIYSSQREQAIAEGGSPFRIGAGHIPSAVAKHYGGTISEISSLNPGLASDNWAGWTVNRRIMLPLRWDVEARKRAPNLGAPQEIGANPADAIFGRKRGGK